MLYKSIRNENDAYTAYRALHENFATDGGVFIPIRMPELSSNEILELASAGFSGAVAAILNKFFSCHLSDWDIDFCIGRNAVKLQSMTHRMVVAELWHNPDGSYGHVCTSLYNKICDTVSKPASEWFAVASHISVLFGIYSEMCRGGIIDVGDRIDVATLANDLSAPVAAVYARQMGLPIGTVALSCEDKGDLWDMIHLGELSVSAYNVDGNGYERLVHATMGVGQLNELLTAMHAKRTFRIPEDQLGEFNAGLFCSVVGKDRSVQNVNSIYRSNGYILDTSTALTVAGLQDYRAKTGDIHLTLVQSWTSPRHCLDCISDATGISQDKLLDILKNPIDRRR